MRRASALDAQPQTAIRRRSCIDIEIARTRCCLRRWLEHSQPLRSYSPERPARHAFIHRPSDSELSSPCLLRTGLPATTFEDRGALADRESSREPTRLEASSSTATHDFPTRGLELVGFGASQLAVSPKDRSSDIARPTRLVFSGAGAAQTMGR
jgi:hypothetical protein